MNGISFRQHDVCRYFTTLQLQINDKKRKTDGLMDTLESMPWICPLEENMKTCHGSLSSSS